MDLRGPVVLVAARPAVVAAWALQPTADALQPTADGGILEGARDFGDTVVNANFVFADLHEPVAVQVTADTTAYTADNTTLTADGGILTGASDRVDAKRKAVYEIHRARARNAVQVGRRDFSSDLARSRRALQLLRWS
jgi:hypothetical protein